MYRFPTLSLMLVLFLTPGCDSNNQIERSGTIKSSKGNAKTEKKSSVSGSALPDPIKSEHASKGYRTENLNAHSSGGVGIDLEMEEIRIPRHPNSRNEGFVVQPENPKRIAHYKKLAAEFWRTHPNSKVEPLKPQSVDTDGLGLSLEQENELIKKVQRLRRKRKIEEAEDKWELAKENNSITDLQNTEKSRQVAGLTRKQLGMTDIAVGRVIANHHKRVARILWVTVKWPNYTGNHLLSDERPNPEPSRGLLYKETLGKNKKKEASRKDSKVGAELNNDADISGHPFPLPPLKESLKAIDHHLKKADLKRKDIYITLDAIAKILAK